jgi:HK97 family phage prohead protease
VVSCVLADPRLRSLPREGITLLKGSDLVVAGYASVELVDKQGDLITKEALKDAFQKFMENSGFRNVQLAHSNIQIGEVVKEHTDNNGRVWKSEVDDVGMFVVVKLRNDIEKAREVAAEIRKGNLRGFSIGGQAFKRMNKSDKEHGSYTEISKLELHEVTICEKGINAEATFRILKEDTNMTIEDSGQTDTLDQLSSVLNRLEGRIDSMEKGENPFEDLKDKKKNDDNGDDDNGDDDNGDEKTEKSEYSDVISSEYLSWLEDTVKSGGLDTASARAHFDEMNKAQMGGDPNIDGASYFGGQAPKREQVEGKPETPKANYGTGGKGKKSSMEKSEFLHPDDVNPADVEAAYQVYKAAAQEQQFKSGLGEVFADRLGKEQEVEKAEAERTAFDARAPLGSIQKAIEDLNERIDNFNGGESGTEIQKSGAPSTAVPIPTTEELATMEWGEVHRLAGSVWQGE